MEIAKALILAGRFDGRHGNPEERGSGADLFPIANCPILFHNLKALRAAGVLDMAILTERHHNEPIQRAVGNGHRWELSFARFIDWSPPSGLAGALAVSDEFLGGEPVLVQHGCAFLSERVHALISRFARERLDALALRLAGPARATEITRARWGTS